MSENVTTPWLTASEAATYLQAGAKFVYRACREDKLRHVRLSGRREIRTRREWCDEFLMRYAQGGAEQQLQAGR